MFLKALGVISSVTLGALYMTGNLGFDWSRDLGKPKAEVMRALADLDIREGPGAPGTDASMSGGIPPLFKLEQDGDRMTWLVMSGDKVATRMTAMFEPMEGGAQTRVTASVDRGDAPDDYVSPVFRSESLTLALFIAALENELNELAGAERQASAEECEALMRRFTGANVAGGGLERDRSLTEAIGSTAGMAIRLNATDAEWRRNGCDRYRVDAAGSAMRPPIERMSEAEDMIDDFERGRERASEGLSFAPGKPNLDVQRAVRNDDR